MKTVELREQRAQVIADARKICDLAEAENRELSSEEKTNFDAAMADASKIEERYLRLEQLAGVESNLNATQGRVSDPIALEEVRAEKGIGSKEYRKAVSSYMVGGRNALDSVETRDISIGTDNVGGYLVDPSATSQYFIKPLNNAVFVRRLATIERCPADAKSVGVSSIATDFSDASWTAEAGTLTADTAFVAGRVELTPQILAKYVKLSLRSVMASGLVQKVLEQLAYKFAISEENGFLNGSGSSQQPLGVFTASASGVPTSRDVSTDNTTTTVTADNLFNVKYNLKEQYRRSPSCAWVLHRDVRKMVSKLKDGQGQYLLSPGLQAGTPDTLLGHAVYESEFAPAVMTTGLYVGMLADFSYYHIIELDSFSVQRLDEILATTNQVAWIGREWLTASPVLPEAFSRIKLA